MTIEERQLELSKNVQARMSAETFLADGIRLQFDDPDYAHMCFEQAEELFRSIGDCWNAASAAQWKISISDTLADSSCSGKLVLQ